MIREKHREETEISVERCPEGIIPLRITSVRTSRKSSSTAEENPARIMAGTQPVRATQKQTPTPRALIRRAFL